MIISAAAAAVVSSDDNLAIVVENPKATETEKASPKNDANGVGVENVPDILSNTTTTPITTLFSSIAGILPPKMFERSSNNNGPSMN